MFCECGCGKLAKVENRFVNHHYSHTKEHKQRASVVQTGNQHHLGHHHTEGTKRKLREARKGRKPSLGMKHTEEWKKNNSKLHKGRIVSEKTRQKHREANKRIWADPEHKDRRVKAILRASHIRPNKAETQLLNLLESIQPGDWKYVGDGSFVIAGKNPDFINVNGKKQIIELFGDYWHKGQNPQDRIDMFSPFGFRTLVIWEHELNNVPRLINRIKQHSI